MTSTTEIAAQPGRDCLRPVRLWLYGIAALLLLTVLVGGATRLTDSGLSITTWQPISGIIPPLGDTDWSAEFEAYQQIPEYELVNRGMSLEEFKTIFWWEWGHRGLGRLIGVAFLVPFVIFLWQRRLSWRLAPALALLFVLGGLQGALGWWMVTSGLAERVDVSQYRLAAHLAAACILFLALIFVARRIRPPRAGEAARMRRAWSVGLFAALVFLQIVAGAFVAGLDAGLAYNTWPLMDGALAPDGLFVLSPWWVNFFENAATVQLTHRLIAYVIVLAAFWLAIASFRRPGWRGPHVWAPVIVALTLIQAALGIATLVLAVPIGLALAHQGTAFLLAGSSIAWLEDLTHPSGNPIPQDQSIEISGKSNAA